MEAMARSMRATTASRDVSTSSFVKRRMVTPSRCKAASRSESPSAFSSWIGPSTSIASRHAGQ